MNTKLKKLKTTAEGRGDRPSRTIPKRVMNVREVSEYLRVHRATIYRLLKLKRIPGFRIGGDWRFNVELIDRWRSELEAKLAPPVGNQAKHGHDPRKPAGGEII